MGLGGVSIWKLLIVLLILVLIFGTKRLKTIASDLGAAAKSLRGSLQAGEPEPPEPPQRARAEQPDAEFPELKDPHGRR